MIRKLIAVSVPLLAALMMVGAPAASATEAGAGAAVVVGSGTIGPCGVPIPSPGNPNPSCANNVTFGGNISGIFGHVTDGPSAGGAIVVQGTCNFSGSGTDTPLVATGSVGGSCAGGTQVGSAAVACAAGSIAYTRVGAVVVILGTCTVTVGNNVVAGPDTSITGTVAGAFVFVPTSAAGAPVTSYALAGVAGFAGVS
jgi:hypothetical protein